MKPVKVLHCVPTVDRGAGGVGTVVRDLSRHQTRVGGVDVGVLCLDYSRVSKHDGAMLELPDITITKEPLVGPPLFGFSPSLHRRIVNLAPDVWHVHGLWMYMSLASLLASRRMGCRYLVSPHGMLDEWALRQSRWKKRLSSALYEKRHLRGAACLHALTDEEAGAIRRFGIDAPICVVPNGVTLRSSETGLPVPWNGLLDEEWNIVLSLGRLHWKKGLTNLIEGFYLAQQRTSHAKNWAVVIVGPDENGYRDVLQKQIEAMDLGKRVVIVAPQYGPLAEACFERAKAFILPSYSEGLPMVILEAWAHRLPVLMTRECNLPVGFNRGAAIEVLPTAESVAEGLMNLFSTTDADRTQMGTRGRTLIEERFTWEQVTKSFTEIYSWVSNGGSPPSSVVMN